MGVSLTYAPSSMQVINLVKPIASVKKLVVTQQFAADVPELVTGDDKRYANPGFTFFETLG